jgi:hypothetical protein
MPDRGNLRERIIKEKAAEYENALDRNFDLAKQLIRITKDGKVEIAFKENLSGKDRILLYLVGKLYAKHAELSSSENAGNNKLMDELGIPEGSLLPWLMDLRKDPGIKEIKQGKYVFHYIPIHLVEPTLRKIDETIKKRS